MVKLLVFNPHTKIIVKDEFVIADNVTSVYTSGRKCNFKDKAG